MSSETIVFLITSAIAIALAAYCGRLKMKLWEAQDSYKHYKELFDEEYRSRTDLRRLLHYRNRESNRTIADLEKQFGELEAEHNDLICKIGAAYNVARSGRVTRNLNRNFFKKGSRKMNDQEPQAQTEDAGPVAGPGVKAINQSINDLAADKLPEHCDAETAELVVRYVVGARRLIHDVPGVPEVYLVPGEIGRGRAPVYYTFETLRGNRTLKFHSGPIDKGFDGWTNEALVAILVDRFEGFQSGDYACETNARALEGLRIVQQAMADRTSERRARGVEGKQEK